MISPVPRVRFDENLWSYLSGTIPYHLPRQSRKDYSVWNFWVCGKAFLGFKFFYPSKLAVSINATPPSILLESKIKSTGNIYYD